jgi:uncharacterized protein
MMHVTETEGGCILEVAVKPRSRSFKVTIDGENIVVFCTEEPVKGRVNKEIIKELSRLFHRKVELVSGFSSREKKLLVRDITKSEIEVFLKGD